MIESKEVASKRIEGGEVFAETLHALGVDYVFMNTGSDSIPIMNGLMRLGAGGRETPSPVLCPHEGVAVSMAEGYAMTTGKPQMVVVHVDVGTQNCGSALHNVVRDRVPLVLFAGMTPSSLDEDVRGSKDTLVHWLQDTPDQSSILRDYVKWSFQVTHPGQVPHALVRAFQVAATPPEGPSYLLASREVLMQRTEPPIRVDKTRHRPPRPSQPDVGALQEAADVLLSAEAPVILTSYLGKEPAAVKELVEISELLSIPVLEPKRERTNFPTTHPDYQGRSIPKYVAEADAIVLLNVDVPWLFHSARKGWVAKPREDAKIIQIDVDPLKERIPVWGFPVDLSMSGDPALALSHLRRTLAGSDKLHSMAGMITERAARLKSEHKSMKAALANEAQAKKSSSPISPAWLFYVLNKVKGEDTIVIDDSVTNNPLVLDYLETTRAGTFFGLMGSSMGWGLPAALGAKLANRERDVLGITGDGSFVFSNPVAGLYVARRHKIRVLQIVINNRGYAAVKKNFQAAYGEEWHRAGQEVVGVNFDEPADYAAVAKSCGCIGITLEDPREAEQTLSDALAESRKKTVVVDALVETI